MADKKEEAKEDARIILSRVREALSSCQRDVVKLEEIINVRLGRE